MRYDKLEQEHAAAVAPPAAPPPVAALKSHPFVFTFPNLFPGDFHESLRVPIIKFFQDCGLFIYPEPALIMAHGPGDRDRALRVPAARPASPNRKDWSKVLPLLQGGQWKEVLGLTASSDSAIGKIVHNGLSRLQSSRRRDDIDAAMEEGMMEIVPRLEKRTHYIATFANVIISRPSSGSKTTLSCSLGSVREMTAVAGSVWLML